jgi:hypothetical protein
LLSIPFGGQGFIKGLAQTKKRRIDVMKKCSNANCSEIVDDKFKFCKKHYYENVKTNSVLKNSGGYTNPSNSLPPFDVSRIKDIHFQLCIKVAGGLVSARKSKILSIDDEAKEVVRIGRLLFKEAWPE